MDDSGDLLVKYTKKHKLVPDDLPNMESMLMAIDHPEQADPQVVEYLKLHADLEDDLRTLRENAFDA